jgi:signal transduction histidine kinase
VKRVPGREWAAAGAIGLLAGAAWLRTGALPWLALASALALLSGWVIWRMRGPWSAAAGSTALLLFAGLGAADAARIRTFQRAPDVGQAAASGRARADAIGRLANEAERLRALAVAALDAPAAPAAAFDHLEQLRAGDAMRAIALVRAGALTAWTGRYHAPVDSLQGPVGVAANEFYLILYAVAGRDRDRAVATALIHAEPPGDALTTALDQELVRAHDIAGFAYAPPEAAVDSTSVVRVAGVPVLAVRALSLGPAQMEERFAERARSRGAMVLALGVLLFLMAVWRHRPLGERFAALGVTIAALAVVPLAGLSNTTAVFNPTYFYVGAGGPLTASIGGLALTTATILVAVLAAQRAGLFPRRRWPAAAIVAALATVGPFLLGAITRGIRFPATGASVLLWLTWETTVFLAAIVILFTGLAAGAALIGQRWWVPRWVPPAFAGLATAAAYFVITPRGGLPQWYTVAWVVTIAATALTRQGRGALWSAATVAAFGSLAVVWSETVKARVQLAEQDVGALGVADPAAAELANRFQAQLDLATAPRSRVELLARYARSELANSDFPVNVTSWRPDGAVLADLRVVMGPGRARGIEYFAKEAADAMRPVLTNVPGDPGMLTIVAFPHADRSVTTVVVAPRTRLVERDPFPALSGGVQAGDVGGEAPYSLQLAPASEGAFISTAAQWTRRDQELHGDWFLPPGSGTATHVHARVPLNGYGALVARGALIVCANLGLLGLLWLLLVVADGGAWRWVRVGGLAWVRSFRARLTVSLFAAFILPTVGFAVWGYARVQDQDAESRDLLVRETLRTVTAAPTAGLDSLGARFGTPLFLFVNSVQVASSDPLFDALAPIGRLLPASAARKMLTGDEGFATDELLVAGQPMRFGFRVLNDSASSANLVLAAPARTAELALDARRRDLAFFLLFATVVGALGALWISGIAARTFVAPIGELREGALALAAGDREPRLAGNPPAEFTPVFAAFRQMARDLEAGRARDARAQRVLAWGEMARQVAHEIKNPLTPMRLGVQHLIRARDDPRVDFRQAFDENAARLLGEIDRLDEIARAFSRYGTAPDAQPAPTPVDVAEAVRDVVRLEQLGADGIRWDMEGTDAPVMAMARATELREVLLNVLENARLANATRVTARVAADSLRATITVRDDGHGIAPEALSRVFEPHFSTRTSGSGLGLAISRRLIDGWGGTIAIESDAGAGTTLTISLVAAGSA